MSRPEGKSNVCRLKLSCTSPLVWLDILLTIIYINQTHYTEVMSKVNFLTQTIENNMVFQDDLHYCRIIYNDMSLFLCKCNLHCCCWRDLEPLESILSNCWLCVILKFNKGNIMTSRYKSYFLETLESAMQYK